MGNAPQVTRRSTEEHDHRLAYGIYLSITFLSSHRPPDPPPSWSGRTQHGRPTQLSEARNHLRFTGTGPTDSREMMVCSELRSGIGGSTSRIRAISRSIASRPCRSRSMATVETDAEV